MCKNGDYRGFAAHSRHSLGKKQKNAKEDGGAGDRNLDFSQNYLN